jgi:hypothetical protein
LTIADFPDPAPRNNHFWHIHRKVLIDAFAQHPDRVGVEAGGQVCNVETNEYYDYRDSNFNIVNMWISGLPSSNPSAGGLTGSAQRFMTPCNGGKATRGIQAAVELQPEQMPSEYYTFAIERNSTGYTMEVSGNFVRSGIRTVRLYRPFEVDGEPIWHYNTKPEEYDGRFNFDLVQDENWNFGSFTWPDQWPEGSSYPDSFVIGDLYTNAYEGVASVTDIKLFKAKPKCKRTVLMTTDDIIQSGERLVNVEANVFLDFNENAQLQLWRGSPENPELVLWENKVNLPSNVTYYTRMQEDGNLVSYKLDSELSDPSSQTIIWMTQATGPVDGRAYSLVKECEQNGGILAIFGGLPQTSQDVLWSAAVATSGPTPQPTMSPVSQENPNLDSLNCSSTILMQSGDFLYPGKRVTNYERGLFLSQLLNGNIQVRWGSPEYPGDLVWESGFVGDANHSYYTKFEANSNLITWQTSQDHSFSPVWESGTYRPTISPYFFIVDCSERGNQIAVYEGHPDEAGSGVIWAVDPAIDSLQMPFPKPSAPPTVTPTAFPSQSAAPSTKEIVIDAIMPTLPGASSEGQRHSMLATAASYLGFLIFSSLSIFQ